MVNIHDIEHNGIFSFDIQTSNKDNFLIKLI